MGKTSAFSRKYKKESRAFVYFTFRPNLSTVLPDNALNGRQSHASTLEVLGPVKTLEDAEQLVGVSFVEARAIISNENHRRAILLDLANFDKGDFTPPSIFDGIRNQVCEYLFH
jgi:hypothetical protein